MGRAGVINSGGKSGKNDLRQAVRTAAINKRAGGMGLISGRKAFQKPMQDGVTLLNAYMMSILTLCSRWLDRASLA
jgi:class I fructose-bisphosphate aldolase